MEKKFAKILWKKSLQKYFCEKKIFAKKNSIKKKFTIKFGWNSVNFRKKKSKKILKIILANLLFLKKKAG